MPGTVPGMRFLFPFLLIFTSGEGASALPRCAPPLEGAVACLDGKLCECRHHPGGSIAGRPAAVRWDCGALRPPCGAAAAPPPSLDGGQAQQPLPMLPAPSPPGWWR